MNRGYRVLTDLLTAGVMKKPFNYKNNRAWAENLTIVMQIGLTMAGCIVFCFFIGRYLDRWLDTKGLFVSIFTILGVIGGGNVVYRQIMAVTGGAKQDSEQRENGDH